MYFKWYNFLIAFIALFSAQNVFSGDPMEEEKSSFKRDGHQESLIITLQGKTHTIPPETLCRLTSMDLQYHPQKRCVTLQYDQNALEEIFEVERRNRFCFVDVYQNNNWIKFENFYAMENLEHLIIEAPDFFLSGVEDTLPQLKSLRLFCVGVNPSFEDIRTAYISDPASHTVERKILINTDKRKVRIKIKEIEINIENILRQFPNNTQVEVQSTIEHMPALPLLYTIQEKERVYFSHLKILDLSKNNLKSIEKLAFSNLSSLESLDLTSNYICSLQAFSKTSFLEIDHIDISGNRFQFIKALNRTHAPNLNFLSGVPRGDFEYLSKCTKREMLCAFEDVFLSSEDDSMEEKASMSTGTKMLNALLRFGVTTSDD